MAKLTPEQQEAADKEAAAKAAADKLTPEQVAAAEQAAADQAAAAKAAADQAAADQAAADQAAADAQAAADQAAADQAAADQAAADQQAADQLAAEIRAAAALLKEQDEKMTGTKKPATAFVPVFKDEDGDAIAINSILRVVTKEGALIDPNGVRITSHSPVEILGADVKEGDWYCVQYEAGLLAVQNTKLLK